MSAPTATAFLAARAAYEMARADADELTGNDYSDEEGELLGGAQTAAADALLLTPAPDLAALAYKMEVFADEECFDYFEHIRDPLFAALIADVRRLGGMVTP